MVWKAKTWAWEDFGEAMVGLKDILANHFVGYEGQHPASPAYCCCPLGTSSDGGRKNLRSSSIEEAEAEGVEVDSSAKSPRQVSPDAPWY